MSNDVPRLLTLRSHYVANIIVVFDEQPLAEEAIEIWVAK